MSQEILIPMVLGALSVLLVLVGIPFLQKVKTRTMVVNVYSQLSIDYQYFLKKINELYDKDLTNDEKKALLMIESKIKENSDLIEKQLSHGIDLMAVKQEMIHIKIGETFLMIVIDLCRKHQIECEINKIKA